MSERSKAGVSNDHSGERRIQELARRKARGPMTLEQQALVPPEERAMIFDPKRVHYFDKDVLTAAKERVKHVLLTFDKVAVSYSGGKDSNVVLNLVRLVMDEMGWTQPLDVVFQDEELIPDDVIEHVMSLREQSDRYTLHYVAIPLKGTFFYLGEHIPYVQWDENRNHVRPKPEWAITHLHPRNEPIDQQEIQPYLNERLGWKGRIALFNGLRAQESLKRFRSCTLTKNEYNYIAKDASGCKNVWFVKPIYDWSTQDVFRFFYDFGVTYCKIYDMEMYAGTSDHELRVSTPLHEKSYRYLKRLRVMYPTFFSQLCDVFPGLAAHERYWGDFDRYGIIEKYPKSYAGIIQYVEDTVSNPLTKAKAMKAIKASWVSKENNRRLGKFAEESTGRCYGYPLLHVFQTIIRGVYLDGNIPLHSNPDNAMIAYERAAETEAGMA